MKRKICLIFIISLILLILINTLSFGAEPSDIYSGTTPTLIKTPAQKILGIVQVIGYASAVIMVAYMGTKYILATPEGKSDLKKHYLHINQL